MKRLLTGAAVFAAFGSTLYASDERIEKRVDVRIRGAVAAIADSLEREGVVAEPLIQYALEGTMRRGSPEKILLGVKKWARDLRRSRELLGPNASAAEVEAGAKAIKAGADEQQLLRFRESKINLRFAHASALNTVAYLIAKGVPADTATTVLVNVALLSASDADIRTLQDDIERDIGGGTPPGSAILARAVGLLTELQSDSAVTDGVAPGAALPSTRGTARPADPMANGSLRGSAVGNQTGARPPAPRGKDSKKSPP